MLGHKLSARTGIKVSKDTSDAVLLVPGKFLELSFRKNITIS